MTATVRASTNPAAVVSPTMRGVCDSLEGGVCDRMLVGVGGGLILGGLDDGPGGEKTWSESICG